MNFWQWFFGFILWDTLLEEEKREENDTYDIIINIEIGQETHKNK
jgi:hypothetical protein